MTLIVQVEVHFLLLKAEGWHSTWMYIARRELQTRANASMWMTVPIYQTGHPCDLEHLTGFEPCCKGATLVSDRHVVGSRRGSSIACSEDRRFLGDNRLPFMPSLSIGQSLAAVRLWRSNELVSLAVQDRRVVMKKGA